MAKARGAISLGISALIVIALIITVGFGVYLSDTFNTSTTTSSGSVSITSADSNCLEEVPANATITPSSNSSTVGNYVQFTNGTKIYFPVNSCPQPVTPEVYSLASVIVHNSTFISDGSGSTFFVDSQAGISYSYSNGVNRAIVIFDEWSNQTFEPCGQGNGWALKDLAQIQIGVLENQNKSFDFANLTISVVPSAELNVFNCPAGIVPTATSQSANTSTIIQTSSDTTNDATVTSSETCTPAATVTQSYITETVTLCHTESTRSSNSSSSG
jgi:hypothetical protein